MIEKKFKCPAERCEKVYGSEASLQQHMKIKHIPEMSDKYLTPEEHQSTL